MTDWSYDYYIDELMAYETPRDRYKPAFPKGSFQEVKNFKPNLKIGDRVRLKNGTAEIEVTEVYKSPTYYEIYISGKYVNSDNTITRRTQNDFVKYDGESKMTTNANKLYTWKLINVDGTDVDLYGHYLATNSQGEWVMEVKGSGVIMAVAKDKVQEVLPYTIGVRFNNNGTTYHYLADKGKFTEGFYLVKDTSSSGWQIARVVDVDTKFSKATVEFSPLGKLAVDLY